MFTKEQIKDNRAKWLKALKSGDYEKGKAYLNKDNKFCCLGVACELFKDNMVLSSNLIAVNYDYRCSTAPNHVIKALGLYSEFGDNLKRNSSLASINDKSTSFKPVIKAIKTNQYWKDLDEAAGK